MITPMVKMRKLRSPRSHNYYRATRCDTKACVLPTGR